MKFGCFRDVGGFGFLVNFVTKALENGKQALIS
jgi:hypothetical protein